MKIDYKITTWERFDIDDRYREDLLSFLKENPKATAMDIYNWSCGIGCDPYIENTVGTDREMTTSENNGNTTIEIYENTSDDPIWVNGINH
jgi:hypothetical protein